MKILSLAIVLAMLLSCKGKQAGQATPQGAEATASEELLPTESFVDGEGEDPDTVLDESSLRYLKLDISNTIGVVALTQYGYSDDVQKREDVGIRFLNNDGSVWFGFDFLGSYSDEWEHNNKKVAERLAEEDFDPRVIIYEYDTFAVDCVSQDDEYYTVLVQHFPKVTKRLKKTNGLNFQTWEQHIQRAIIDPIYTHSELRDSPNGKLIEYVPDNVKNGDGYYGLQVEGEWVKVRDIFDEDAEFTGWIRWKDGDQLLVGLYYSI